MGKNKYQQICKFCGKEYLSQKPESNFCSHECSCNSRKGVKKSEEYCKKLSKIKKKQFKNPEFREKQIKISIQNLPKNVAGENNPNFRNWSTRQSKSFRVQNNFKFNEWRNRILKKCDNKCVLCGKKKGILDAHHIIPLCETTKPAFELWNGVILCRKCHGKTDSFGGKGKNKSVITYQGDQKIIIKFVPLQFQEYETLGNYKNIGSETYFIITDTGNDLHNKIILLHELIEQTLTEAKGIKESQILKHDLEFEKLRQDGLVGEDDEPGEHKNSPYKQEHIQSEIIERQLLNYLNIDFKEYTRQITKVFEDANN
jgi:hypothetical protein